VYFRLLFPNCSYYSTHFLFPSSWDPTLSLVSMPCVSWIVFHSTLKPAVICKRKDAHLSGLFLQDIEVRLGGHWPMGKFGQEPWLHSYSFFPKDILGLVMTRESQDLRVSVSSYALREKDIASHSNTHRLRETTGSLHVNIQNKVKALHSCSLLHMMLLN